MFSKILVGFDGSEPAVRALRTACAIAEKFDASIEVMHTPRDETIAFAASGVADFYMGQTAVRDEALAHAADKMAEQAREIAGRWGVERLVVRIGYGNPAEDLLARAKEDNVDLIVTGRRGLGGVRGLLLGSTSHAISARAECACMTVA